MVTRSKVLAAFAAKLVRPLREKNAFKVFCPIAKMQFHAKAAKMNTQRSNKSMVSQSFDYGLTAHGTWTTNY
jgi:hypothetical protein